MEEFEEVGSSETGPIVLISSWLLSVEHAIAQTSSKGSGEQMEIVHNGIRIILEGNSIWA